MIVILGLLDVGTPLGGSYYPFSLSSRLFVQRKGLAPLREYSVIGCDIEMVFVNTES